MSDDWRPRVEAMIAGQAAAPQAEEWITPAEPEEWITPAEPAPQMDLPRLPDAGAVLGRIAGSAVRGGVQGFREGGVINLPVETQRAVDQFGPVIGYPMSTLGAGLDLAARAGTGLFRGAQAGVQQAFDEFGQPAMGRDVAAMPEAFLGGTGMPRARGLVEAPVRPAGPTPLIEGPTGPRPTPPAGPAPGPGTQGGGPALTPPTQRPPGPLPTTWGEVLSENGPAEPPQAPPPPAPAPRPSAPSAAGGPLALPSLDQIRAYVLETGDLSPGGIQRTFNMPPIAVRAAMSQLDREGVLTQVRERNALQAGLLPSPLGAPQEQQEEPSPLPGRKQSLAEMMADPRSNEEIRADQRAEEQARQQAEQEASINETRARLPEGFTLQRQEQGWALHDPTGQVVAASEGVPDADTLATWADDAAYLSQNVDWEAALRQGDGTRGAPVVVSQPSDIEAAAGNTNRTPTPDQAAAGNYQKGHVRIGGLDIAIENPAGSERHGIGPDGMPWTAVLPADYGYIKRSRGADGDQVDVYLGPDAHNAERHPVFVIDQIDPETGQFDEHKAMLGYPNRGAAVAAYRAAFSDGSGDSRIGAVTELGFQPFVLWAKRGDTMSPLAWKPPAAAGEGQGPLAQPPAEPTGVAGTGGPEVLPQPAPVIEPPPAAEEPNLPELLAEANALETALADGAAPGAPDQWEQAQTAGTGPIEEPEDVRPAAADDGDGARPDGTGGGAGEAPADAGEPTAGPVEGSAPAGPPDGGEAGTGVGGEAADAGPRAADQQPEPSNAPEPDGESGRPAAEDAVAPEPAQQPLDVAGAEGPETAAAGVAPSLPDAFRDAFLDGRKFPTIVAARRFANELTGQSYKPGTVAAKLLDEAIEAGVVTAARRIIDDMRADPAATFDRLVALYQQQPKLSVRTADSIQRQAYSTPAPLAWAASQLAGISPSTRLVYEPTAGNGILVVGARPSSVAANEIDPERRAFLESQGFQSVTGRDATKPAPAVLDGSADVVIANPPFGIIKDDAGRTVRFDLGFVQPGYQTGEIDHAIALRALESMRDGGSAVLILGGINKQVRSAEGRSDAYNGKAKREFFFTLYGKYNVVDHFTVPGELYERQGAGWPVDIIVIRGRGKSARPLPSVQAPRIVPTWDAIKEVMSNGPAMANGESPAGLGDNNEPDGVGGATGPVGSEGDDGSTAVPAATDAEGAVDAGAGAGPDDGAAASPGGDDAGGAVGGNQPLGQPGGSATGDAPGEPGVRAPSEPGSGAGASAVDRSPDGARTEGDRGDGAGRVDRRRATKPEDGPGVTEKAQVDYQPTSRKGTPVGTLVPTNLSSATSRAMTALEDRTGKPVDSFVADLLGYTFDELTRYFSGEQIDAIALGIEQINRGQGFVIGDQTGVGKGRVVAAMIRYAERKGLVPVFVTEKPNLFADMARDLSDIGMADMVEGILPTNNALRLALTDDPSGPRLRTGDAKAHNELLANVAREVERTGELPKPYRVVMTTYNQMQTVKGNTTLRMAMLSSLARNAFLILDESHNAGGSGGDEETLTAAGKMPRSVFFRRLVADARSTFYSSATWAKRPNVMDLYGAKTAMRDAVDNIGLLAETIARGGVPMQQIVTSQLAEVGQYIRRERSFDGVTYDLVPVPVDRGAYNEIASILAGIFQLSEQVVRPVIKDINKTIREGAKSIAGDSGVGDAGATSTSFGSVMHNLINQMLLAAKAQGTVERALIKLREDKKPVITVANTMGSFIQEFAQENGAQSGDELPLTFNNLLMRYLKRTLRWVEKKPFSKEKGEEHWLAPSDLGSEGEAMYRGIEAAINALDLGNMPVSPIDYIRSKLTEAGYRVGEITGRTEAADYAADGTVRYRVRPGKELTTAGRQETIRGFNRGDLDVVILNQSGATGLSLHANAPFKDRRKRAMLIAQAEANIDTHMQMLGRVHRTGQVVAPEYEQLVADIPAEKRPAAVLAAKMASLNASTTSSRRAAIGATNTPDFINRYGGRVIGSIVSADEALDLALGRPLGTAEEGDEDWEGVARKVTGRIPLLPLDLQEQLYQTIEQQYLALIEELDAAGENGLEAKTLDLDAKTIEAREFIPAKGQATNPFASAATLNRMDVRRTTRPPKPGTVVVDIARALEIGGVKADDFADASIDDMASRIADMEATEGQPRSEALMRKLDIGAETERRKAAASKDPEAAAKRLKMIEAAVERIGAFLRVAVPGAVVDLRNADDDEASRALVINVEFDGKTATAAGNYEVTLLSAEGVRRRITGTNIYASDVLTMDEAKDGARIIRPVEDQHAVADFLANLEAESKNAREERWIITGNILAAFAQQSGQIVNFTDEGGEIRQGIMLAKDWDPEKAAKKRTRKYDAATVIQFLSDPRIDLPFVESTDGVIRIARDSSGKFTMWTAAAKGTGGAYFLNRGIQDAMTWRSMFVKSGDKMRANFEPQFLEAVIGAVGSVLAQQKQAFTSSHPSMTSPAEGDARLRVEPVAPAGWGMVEAEPRQEVTPEAEAAAIEAVQRIVGPRGAVQATRRELRTKPGMPVAVREGASVGGFAIGGLVRVAIAGAPERFTWSLHHEAVHALRNLGLFSQAEWDTLREAAKRQGWIERFGLRSRYPNLDEEKLIEEAIAEAFGAASRDAEDGPKGGMVRRAWNRTARFLDAFKNALAGRGLRTAEGVFEQAASGRIGQRQQPLMATRGPQTIQEAIAAADRMEGALAVPGPDGEDVDLMLGMSPELEAAIRERGARAVQAMHSAVTRIWRGTPAPEGVLVENAPEYRDINPVTSYLKVPERAFANTELLPVIYEGIRAEENQSRWITRLVHRYDQTRKRLEDAGGDFDRVSEALWAGDAEQVDNKDEAARAELFRDWALSPAEQTAFMEFHELLETMARLHDNHERAMMPQVQREKERRIASLESLLNHAKLSGTEARRLYRLRAVLTRRIAAGKSPDLANDARQIEAINLRLREMRAADPANQARIAELQQAIDQAEAKLNSRAVRGQLKGYVPHKFYGSWRLWELGEPDPETGERPRAEITSDQGFYNTREDAFRAAAAYLEQNPDADLVVGPKQIRWPASIEATTVSDSSFARLAANLAVQAELRGPELYRVLNDVARRRTRRRMYGPGRFRRGAAGYSREMDRVMRTHIGQTVRYVTMDRLKYRAITAMERAGLSPYRVITQDRPNLQRAFERWLADVNGNKQPMEMAVDSLLRRLPIPASVVMTGVLGFVLGGAAATPLIGAAAAGYFGFQMWKTLTGKTAPWRPSEHHTEFPTRQFLSHMATGMAHLKLGAFMNIKSALVNLSQTAINTWPTLGTRYTIRGIKRASQATFDAARGRQTPDTRLMERAGIQSLYRISEAGPVLAEHESKLERASMWMFQGAENINRAVAFFGAYERALDDGRSAGDAIRDASEIVRQTQFHMGNANKPELLRQQWARLPFQFKNFMAQQIARMFMIPRRDVAKTLIPLAVLGGVMAMPGFQILNAMTKLVADFSVEDEIARWTLDRQKDGGVPANLATVFARGLPAIYTDISQSVGMGAGFLPMTTTDLQGPWWGFLDQQAKASKLSAPLVDRLTLVSPSFLGLKALEAAANGQSITSAGFWDPAVWGDGKAVWTDWRQKGAKLYEPSTGQLISRAFNFTPAEESQIRMVRRQANLLEQELSDDTAGYIADIIQARREGRYDDVAAIQQKARANGIPLTAKQVTDAVKRAELDQLQRSVREAPKSLQPRINDWRLGVEGARQ